MTGSLVIGNDPKRYPSRIFSEWKHVALTMVDSRIRNYFSRLNRRNIDTSLSSGGIKTCSKYGITPIDIANGTITSISKQLL